MAGTLKSVEVIPQGSSVARGRTEQFGAIGHYSDGSTQDLTATATWVSTVTSVATITATGLATGVALGTTSITATSGGFSGSSTLTIIPYQHNHITESFIVNGPMGHLKFRQLFAYDTPSVVEGPDPHTGHINHNSTGTIIIQPKPRDDLQNVLEVRADIPAPKFYGGQEGRMVKDPAFPIRPIVESSTSSDSTAGIWRRGKYFSKKIKF